MIKRITIKNFRSLKDVTVDLQDVNLFIGPNNSGKSNFFKALEFLSDFRLEQEHLFASDFANYCFNKVNPKINDKNAPPIEFLVIAEQNSKWYCYRLVLYKLDIDYAKSRYSEFWGTLNDEKSSINNIDPFDIKSLQRHFSSFKLKVSNINFNLFYGYEGIEKLTKAAIGNSFSIHSINKNYFSVRNDLNTPLNFDTEYLEEDIFDDEVIEILDGFVINAPDPALMKYPYVLTRSKAKYDHELDGDVGNFVGFIERMRDDYPQVPEKIINSFRNHFHDINRLVLSIEEPKPLRKDIQESNDYITKKFGLVTDRGVTFWSDELSDGVLYFLALLAIIHQPKPPKLIMLEEPEKGIHPRRIREVIDYIFQLAEEKGIQIIISSHSTYVVDEFKDIPEAVFVFDKEGAETQIKNLQTDIIEPSDKKSDEAGLPRINYTKSLGTHWAVGFIGGVPQ